MRIRKMIAAMLVGVCFFGLTACQLAREGAAIEEGYQGDRLVGVLVTTEYLNIPWESDGRIYAVLKDRTLTEEGTGKETTIQEFVFEDVEGFPYFVAYKPLTGGEENVFESQYTNSQSHETISDSHMGLHYSDEEEKITLEGTIYFAPKSLDMIVQLNPIYQQPDGRLYVTSGSSMGNSGSEGEGMGMTSTLDETTAMTENGKTKKFTTNIKISISSMFPPEKIVLLQMDKGSSILSRQEFAPGDVPSELVPEEDTAYIIVETHKRDNFGEVVIGRELYSGKDEMLFTFMVRGDGVLEKALTTLVWGD